VVSISIRSPGAGASTPTRAAGRTAARGPVATAGDRPAPRRLHDVPPSPQAREGAADRRDGHRAPFPPQHHGRLGFPPARIPLPNCLDQADDLRGRLGLADPPRPPRVAIILQTLEPPRIVAAPPPVEGGRCRSQCGGRSTGRGVHGQGELHPPKTLPGLKTATARRGTASTAMDTRQWTWPQYSHSQAAHKRKSDAAPVT
jgi:hypothetical protein